MQASDGDHHRFTTSVRKVLASGPRWESNRVLMGGAAAVTAVLAITGVIALSTSGSASTQAKDAAATTKSTPHYLLPIAALIKDGSVPAPTLAGDNGTVGVPTGTAARPTTPPTTPTNSSDISTYRGGAGTMTPVGIATLALERGCAIAQAPTATAIAMAESGGSPSAQGDITLMTPVWDWSAGLWQIRGLRSERGTGALRDSVANQQAATNSQAMFVISSGCTNWTPWTTYTRGLYLGYLGIARQAVNYVVSYYKAHGHYPTVAAPDPTAVIPVASGAGAGGAAVPATAASTSHAATPAKTKGKAAPKASASAARSTGAAQQGSGGGGGGKTKSSSTPTAKKSPPGVPTLPSTLPVKVPTKAPTTLPIHPPSLPVSIPPVGQLP